MAIKAILLDLDGTILNTLEDLTDSVNFALSSLGFPTHSISKIRSIVGNGARNLIKRALPENCDDAVFEKCLAAFKAHYEKNKSNKTAPYDGIMPALAKLRAEGFRLAIVSNKHDDAVQGLHKHFFSEYVQFAIGNVEFLPKKPNPDMVHYALEKLGVNCDEAIYVGDSEVDILTAKNSGIPCISVTWGFRNEDVLTDAGADTIVNTPEKLYRVIIENF
ncbi:MAG: HAD-IIIA family hydrolase [Oscillospiraceae bacterium]|nr:HAD-IIIA family hydrolase [Oscillospiraceae bacterium]